MFIIHLVPLVLGKIFICRKIKKWTKDVHIRQVHVAGAMGPQGHVG
jgi:hypothetical protein